jgi:hypothetical protein
VLIHFDFLPELSIGVPVFPLFDHPLNTRPMQLQTLDWLTNALVVRMHKAVIRRTQQPVFKPVHQFTGLLIQ